MPLCPAYCKELGTGCGPGSLCPLDLPPHMCECWPLGQDAPGWGELRAGPWKWGSDPHLQGTTGAAGGFQGVQGAWGGGRTVVRCRAGECKLLRPLSCGGQGSGLAPGSTLVTWRKGCGPQTTCSGTVLGCGLCQARAGPLRL